MQSASAKQLKEMKTTANLSVHAVRPKTNQSPPKHRVHRRSLIGRTVERRILRNHVQRLEDIVISAKENIISLKCANKRIIKLTLSLQINKAPLPKCLKPNRAFVHRKKITGVTTESSWFSGINVGGTSVKFKLDTGAEANVLPVKVYYKLHNKLPLTETGVVLFSYGDFKVKPEGKIPLFCEAQGLKESLPFYVAAVDSPPTLGFSSCSELNLVKRVEVIIFSFNTPFGRYRFKQMPFGIRSAPEVFQKRMKPCLETIAVWRSFPVTFLLLSVTRRNMMKLR